MSCVLGIDPGASGGLAYMDGDRIELLPMPYVDKTVNALAIREWLAHLGAPDLVILEKQAARAGNAAGASFTQGTNYGDLRGLFMGMGLPLEIVDPKHWQKALGLTQSGRKKLDDPKADARSLRAHQKAQKQKHIGYCMRRFPEVSLLANERCRVPHDGLADALCIAEFGRREVA